MYPRYAGHRAVLIIFSDHISFAAPKHWAKIALSGTDRLFKTKIITFNGNSSFMLFKTIKVLFIVLLSSVAAFAQNGTGNVSGKIMGGLQPVAGAEVVIMQKDKLIDKTSTDEDGNYSFRYLAAGRYDVRATKSGYRTSIIIQVPIAEDRDTKNDLYLPEINNRHMLSNPLVDDYEHNCRTYMRQR